MKYSQTDKQKSRYILYQPLAHGTDCLECLLSFHSASFQNCKNQMSGIDTPKKATPYGKKAKDELIKLMCGKKLRVFVNDIDLYGRYVANMYCDGIFVQEVILRKGLAWHYSMYDHRLELAIISRQHPFHSYTSVENFLRTF
ncbi:Staphylococcal nuclease (SNase-like) [Theobroma cacao]|uniref:Ca-2+ dependent nuclease-like protein n=1 Tax=Theobroma cacao TaxID=3641 RepID=A0A061EXS5_THECC|nr:Ca-2+ dependent nuclease-like protein [Theobroma cacao]WRX25165.1 Staphylococcal nuclease (SNase-like) [Theobroma cacao]